MSERRGELLVIVGDLEAARSALQSRQLSLGPASGGDCARIAPIADLDGNQITFAQPGPAQRT